jgi:hypothetical protein
MKKYEHYIVSGMEKPLQSVKFHHEAPLVRHELLLRDSFQGDGGIRIVSHTISNLPEKVPSYCELHWHDFDEINLILSEDGGLKYKITIEDEEYIVGAPTTVYLPKGIRHAAEVVSGKGIFLAINATKDYKAYQ